MSECNPDPSADAVRVALPFARVPVPSTVVPSRNVTGPVAVAGVTAAVSETACPGCEGLGEELNDTDAWTSEDANQFPKVNTSENRRFVWL